MNSFEDPKDHVYNVMLLQRELNLPIVPSAQLFEDYIAYQIKMCVDSLADKSEDHI